MPPHSAFLFPLFHSPISTSSFLFRTPPSQDFPCCCCIPPIIVHVQRDMLHVLLLTRHFFLPCSRPRRRHATQQLSRARHHARHTHLLPLLLLLLPPLALLVLSLELLLLLPWGRDSLLLHAVVPVVLLMRLMGVLLAGHYPQASSQLCLCSIYLILTPISNSHITHLTHITTLPSA